MKVQFTRRGWWPGAVSRALASAFMASVLVVVGQSLAVTPAQAAIVGLHSLDDRGAFALHTPYGVAIDVDGNVYVADTNQHRIVKFDAQGNPLLAFGRRGRGELFFPHGVAVGIFNGATLVYVADSSNSRIAVFDDLGRFVREFGTTGAGQLNNPAGIATVPGTPNGGVYVADTRNARVVRFSDAGKFLDSFDCSGCPDGPFGINDPAGLAVRKLKAGLELYVTDQYGGQVHVLSGDGTHIRSFGSSGTDPGQLSLPDDVAVDDKGNAFVAEPGFGAERVSKFGPAGNFLFSFSHGREAAFIQPHGIAMDPETRRLVVANTGASVVEVYREAAARIDALNHEERPFWLQTKGAWFALLSNAAEQTCSVKGTATIVARPGSGSRTFVLDGKAASVGDTEETIMKMAMTGAEVDLVRRTWQRGRKIDVKATFNATCPDGDKPTTTLSYQK